MKVYVVSNNKKHHNKVFGIFMNYKLAFDSIKETFSTSQPEVKETTILDGLYWEVSVCYGKKEPRLFTIHARTVLDHVEHL